MHANAFLELIDIEGCSLEAIRLISCEGYVQLKGIFDFKLELICYDNFFPINCLGKFIRWGWAPLFDQHYLSGYIKSIALLNETPQVKLMLVEVSSSWIFLKKTKKSKVYRYLSLHGLLRTIREQYLKLNFKFNLNEASYVLKESWIQHDETDFAFISRILLANQCVSHVNKDGEIIIEANGSRAAVKRLDAANLHAAVCAYNRAGLNLNFSSKQLVMPGEVFEFKGIEFLVTKIKLQVIENKLQSLTPSAHHFECQIWAKSNKTNLEYSIPKIFGYQLAHITNYPVITEGCLQLGSVLSWDKDNPVSCKAYLAQLWCGYQQGFHFMPRIGTQVALNFMENSEYAIISGSLAENRQQSSAIIQTQFNRIKFSEEVIIKSRGDESKAIEGNYSEFAKGNWQYKLKSFGLSVVKGSYNLIAKKLSFRVGNSRLEMNEASISLSASLIELQTPNASGTGLARSGDYHSCPELNPDLSPHFGGTIGTASNSVFINAKGAASLACHASCQGSEDVLIQGIDDVLIAGRAAIYQGSLTLHGGIINEASTNVLSIPQANSSFEQTAPLQAGEMIEQWLSVQEL